MNIYIKNIHFLKANLLSLAKPIICRWHQSSLLSFCNLKKITPEVWAKKNRTVWHPSLCKRGTVSEFKIEASLYLLISKQKNIFFFQKEGLQMFTDHKRNCNKEINMHDPFSCSTTRLHCQVKYRLHSFSENQFAVYCATASLF